MTDPAPKPSISDPGSEERALPRTQRSDPDQGYAFLLSMGRTGTQLISKLLAGNPDIAIYHEPYELDREIMQLRYSGFHTVADACMATRMDEMSQRSAGKSVHVESNSFLRFEVEWLQRELNARLVYMSRDPRTFLPSAYQRNVYTSADEQFTQVPHDGDPWVAEWGGFSRFEKICWFWNYANQFLFQALGPPVHIETATSSYAKFKEKILDPLALTLDQEIWEAKIAVKVNHSSRYHFRKRWRNRLGLEKSNLETIPPYAQWTDDMKAQLQRICGETMLTLGYEP